MVRGYEGGEGWGRVSVRCGAGAEDDPREKWHASSGRTKMSNGNRLWEPGIGVLVYICMYENGHTGMSFQCFDVNIGCPGPELVAQLEMRKAESLELSSIEPGFSGTQPARC